MFFYKNYNMAYSVLSKFFLIIPHHSEHRVLAGALISVVQIFLHFQLFPPTVNDVFLIVQKTGEIPSSFIHY